MKVFTLHLLFIVLIAVNGFTQTGNDTLLRAKTHYFYYTPTYSDPDDSIVYTYDSKGFLIAELHLTYDPGNKTYRNQRRYLYTNDSLGYHLTFRNQSVSGSSFVEFTQVTYTYNQQHQLLSELMETWNGSTYDKYNITVYTYNTNFSLQSMRKMNWQGAWVTQEFHEFAYDAKGNRVSDTRYDFDGSGLKITALTLSTYDAGNYLIRDSILSYDAVNAVYLLSNVYYYANNADGTRKYISHTLFDNTLNKYVPQYEIYIFYNPDKQVNYSVNSTWNSNTGKFDQNFRNQYSYNSKGKLTRKEIQGWNSATNTYTNNEVYYYYYDNNSGIISSTVLDNGLLLYPVPAGNRLTLDLSSVNGNLDTQNYIVEIRNTTGALVLTMPCAGQQHEIDLGDLSSGIYSLTIHSHFGDYTNRFVKL